MSTACTCTYCSKSGALWGYYRPDEVRIVAAADGATGEIERLTIEQLARDLEI